MTPTHAIALWARVCIVIVIGWIVIFIAWAIVATVSPTTFGITPLNAGEVVALFGLGLAGIAWYGLPVFLLGAGILWAIYPSVIRLRARKENNPADDASQ